jgi:hypothetical protein
MGLDDETLRELLRAEIERRRGERGDSGLTQKPS